MFGISGFQGLLCLADVLSATFLALDEVYNVLCVACGMSMCVVCSSRNSAAGSLGVDQFVVEWAACVVAVFDSKLMAGVLCRDSGVFEMG